MKKKKLTYEHPDLEPVGLCPELMIADSGSELGGERDDFDYVDWTL